MPEKGVAMSAPILLVSFFSWSPFILCSFWSGKAAQISFPLSRKKKKKRGAYFPEIITYVAIYGTALFQVI